MPTARITRRNLLQRAATFGLSLAATGVPSSFRTAWAARADDPIKVGILHSLTGFSGTHGNTVPAGDLARY